MKYNNSDMDDLFRRASERYPLRTDSADWDRLASDLDGEPGAPSDEEERRRRRGVFWLFLLIPLAGIGYLTWQAGVHHAGKKAVAANAVVDKADAAKNAVGRKDIGAAETKVGNEGAAKAGKSEEEVRKMRTRDDSARVGSGGGINGGAQTADVLRGDKVGGPLGGNKGMSRQGEVRKMRTRNDATEVTTGSQATTPGGGAEAIRGSAGVGPIRGSAGAQAIRGSAGAAGDEDHDPALALLDLRRAPIGGRNGLNVVIAAPPKKATDDKPNNNPPKSKTPSHAYVGLLGAPDFSTVHFQTMKGVGTTFSVLLGYAFNKRWAVETGVSLDRKRYYTAGEYFKKEMPWGYKLLNVDGTCYMWEIPINVRYNFNTSRKFKWFATAGLSTYLMSRENYAYQFEYNSAVQDSNANIHKPSQYWFSIVNLSAGFEQRLGKIGNLRLAPYVRIPLSGIGTGSLPVLSAGLNIGITRQLW